MRSRWFHSPLLHTGLHEEKSVSWLELFYDLIFVAAIIQLGDTLSRQVTEQHEVLAPFIYFAALFIPLWMAWTGFTFFANRFTVDDFPHRLLVFLKMFAVGTMAISASDVILEGRHALFALSFAVAQGLIAIMYARAWRQVEEAKPYAQYWGAVFGFGALVWGASALVSAPYCYIFWTAGLLAIFFSPVSKQSRELTDQFPIDMEHLAERYGLLTIIVLGESFVKVLGYLNGVEHGPEMTYLAKGFLSLFLTCSVWWIYFDDVGGSRLREGRGNWVVWLYGHLPLALAITALGVAVKKTISFDFATPPDETYRWLVCVALAIIFLSVGLIDSVTERRNAELSDRARVNSRFTAALFVLLVAQVGGTMSAGLFLGIVTAVCLGLVVFDIMIVPWELAEEEQEAPTTAELYERRQEDDEEARAAGAKEEDRLKPPIRKGAPAELRRDLYFFFMEGSWTRLFIALGSVYLMVNALFAALFMLEPESIAGVAAPNFADAFNFSIQTMSTIGYGTMSPATSWGHVVVALEAAVSILGVAVATGLMFAKASRPQSSVLFSDKMVITDYDGVPTLMFRAGNARGNEVVEASVRVSVLIEEKTPEGHFMRKIKDLKLDRHESPMFTLSWQVMHPIDEESPLYGLDWENLDQQVVLLPVTLTGYDATYAQKTHARHTYLPSDIHPGERFVDVLSETEGGRMMIDFEKFHDTEPDDG